MPWALSDRACNAAQDKGLAAIERLDQSLDEFARLLDDKDKQDVPIKQQEALGFVGAVEEAMVTGFPYEVPKQYAGLPQLKVRAPRPPGAQCALHGGVGEGLEGSLCARGMAALKVAVAKGPWSRGGSVRGAQAAAPGCRSFGGARAHLLGRQCAHVPLTALNWLCVSLQKQCRAGQGRRHPAVKHPQRRLHPKACCLDFGAPRPTM